MHISRAPMTHPEAFRHPSDHSGVLTRLALSVALGLLVPVPLAGQDHDAHADHVSTYAEFTDRTIKALSAEEAAGLERGEGLSLALAAELNGIPGPLHTLEMAEGLALTSEQEEAVRRIESGMKERARELGARILELEGELDQRFAHGHAGVDDVARLTGAIGAARGALRAIHLVAHLETAAVLDAEQIATYARMRGYSKPASS
jgi:hypothetical protein